MISIKRLIHHLPLVALGGVLYMAIELLWRGRTHWSMGVLGGLCFVLIGLLDEYQPAMPVWAQCVTGAAIVTALELVTGLIVNVWLGLGVWDYSAMPLNLWGQICLPYSCAWVVLARVAVWLENKVHDAVNAVKIPKNKENGGNNHV